MHLLICCKPHTFFDKQFFKNNNYNPYAIFISCGWKSLNIPICSFKVIHSIFTSVNDLRNNTHYFSLSFEVMKLLTRKRSFLPFNLFVFTQIKFIAPYKMCFHFLFFVTYFRSSCLKLSP